MANTNKRSLWDIKIVRRALVDALVKLSPRTMMKNPVMFVVEIGSVITSIYLLRDILAHHGPMRCGARNPRQPRSGSARTEAQRMFQARICGREMLSSWWPGT